MPLKDVDGTINSADPDQAAPTGAVWSGSPLFAQSLLSLLSQYLSFCAAIILELPYFFAYKTEFFSFQNYPKDLDPFCKTDLDLWNCLGRVKLV